ncbi:MAG: PAS domain S-box protein [Methanosarcinales archaeon]|nr:PAS domain S-box protein [Methanosarcinales archaeon]
MAIDNIGFNVVGRASTAKVAIEKALELELDLIMMDIVLKGQMNGIDASYEIHKKKNIPIIFLTAHSDLDLIEKAKTIKPYAYLVKPFQERQLLASIEMALDRRQMEIALQESEAQKQAILDGSPDMIMLIDPDMNVLWANRTALDMNPDVIGKTCHKAFTNMDKMCDGCPCLKTISTGQTRMGVKYQSTMAGIKGESYWENIGVPIKDNKGKLINVIIIARNITDRKRSEEALRKSEEFSSGLLINSPNPIVVINPDTFIRYVNPAVERLTGFSGSELIGRKAPYPWWTEESMQNPGLNNKNIRNKVTKFEQIFRKKNGEKFVVEITSTPVKRSGALKYYLENWIVITRHQYIE